MAPNSTTRRAPVATSRTLPVLALLLPLLGAGCSGFFKVTPQGQEPTPTTAKPAATPADKPAAKPADKPKTPPPTEPTKAEPVKEPAPKPPARTPRGRNAAPPPAPAPAPPPVEPTPVEPEPTASDSAGIQRLRALATLWQTVAQFHPYVASRGVAWDSALVRAIPGIRSATDPERLASEVTQLLRVLNDPLTRVEREGASVTIAPERVRAETTADGTLVLRLPIGAALDSTDDAVTRQALARDPLRVVIDMRGPAGASAANDDVGAAAFARWQAFAVRTAMARALTSVAIVPPAERVRQVGGGAALPGRDGSGRTLDEGVDGWLRRDVAMVPAGAGANQARRVVVLANGASVLPSAVLALISSGTATLVGESASPSEPLALDAAAGVSTVRLPLASGYVVRVRTGELQHADGTIGLIADTTVAMTAGNSVSAPDSTPALRAALQLLRNGRMPRAKRTPMSDVAAAALPVRMDNQNYPTMGARLLAGFRLWSAMRTRHVNRDLYDEDLDAVFERVIPRLEAARNEQQYAVAIGDLATALDDAEGVLRGPSVETWLGTSVAPFRVRFIEGRAIITDVVRDAASSMLALTSGTEIVAADGFPLAAWQAEHRRIGATSNEWTRTREQMRVITRGPEGSALFKLRDASNKERSVELPRRAAYAALLPTVQRPDANAVRRLDGGIGYIDLERLSAAQLDSALQSMRGMRALVLDGRADAGGRNSEMVERRAELVLRQLATQPTFVRQREVQRVQSSPCLVGTLRDAALKCADERVQQARWMTVDTVGRYRGRVVMLIDERTQGAMERLAIALESAASVTFVGSTSAGAASPASTLELPGALSVGIPVLEIRRADGGQVQRIGITPAVEVHPTVRGIRNGQDEVIDRAQQWLLQQLDPPVRRKR